MGKYTYKEIVNKAKEIKKNIEKSYKNGADSDWSYYLGKAILKPKTDVTKISIKDAKNQQGEAISRGISKADYTALAKRYVAYVEKHKQLPNYIEYKGIKIAPHLLTGFFAKVVANNYPKTQNINRKWYTKPTETDTTVYDYFSKKTGTKYKTIDEFLKYISGHYHYLKYFDDKESNKEVIDKKAGNCVDLLQMTINWAKAKGYECKCIHVKCRVSGTGHVFGKFRHKTNTGNKWITRDPAAVCDGNDIHKVWCEDGYVQAENPSWFNQNLNR